MNSDPKYLCIAKELKSRISDEAYQVGKTLPTEVSLMDEFCASKQTIRNALRMLQQWGLTYSRRGSGTIVRSKGGQESFIQTLASMADLLQYKPETFIANLQYKAIELSSEEAKLINGKIGEEWWQVNMRRFPASGTKADAYLVLYFRDSHRGIIDLLAAEPKTLTHAVLQEGYGEVIHEVFQSIEPCLLERTTAEKLMAEENSAGLKVTRKYYGADRKLIWFAVVYHPPKYSYDSWFARQVTNTEN
ncbi:MAG: GntR family transcriptional regulator [Sneathiella sp.]|nr:GntR family transcriptional regulator [Sneathiella sp.]